MTDYVIQTLLLPSNQGVVPKWVGIINASYTTDLWTVEVHWRYTGALRFSNTYVTGVDIDQNNIASRYYFNVSGEYQVFDNWRLYARVANLFNVSPPINPSNNLILPMSAQAQSYDRIGRDYSVGIRFKL